MAEPSAKPSSKTCPLCRFRRQLKLNGDEKNRYSQSDDQLYLGENSNPLEKKNAKKEMTKEAEGEASVGEGKK